MFFNDLIAFIGNFTDKAAAKNFVGRHDKIKDLMSLTDDIFTL